MHPINYIHHKQVVATHVLETVHRMYALHTAQFKAGRDNQMSQLCLTGNTYLIALLPLGPTFGVDLSVTSIYSLRLTFWAQASLGFSFQVNMTHLNMQCMQIAISFAVISQGLYQEVCLQRYEKLVATSIT